MLYFIYTITTQYDGYEWIHKGVAQGYSAETVAKRVNSYDQTHDNGIEVQYPAQLTEITGSEYEVLRRFI